MNRKLFIFILMFIALLSSSHPIHAIIPPYAKWGKIAVQEAIRKYDASVVDYQHVGRTQVTDKITEEKFKLWLRKRNNEEFGVFVTITFDSITEQILTITFDETSH